MKKLHNPIKSQKSVMVIFLYLSIFLSSCDNDDPTPSTTKMISVGSYSLETKIEGSGSSSIVFISGLGESLNTWKNIQPACKSFSTTLSYNRAGIGNSHNVMGTRSSEIIAKELDLLLINSKIEGPYILVAHSIGGLHAREYAHLFPEKVAGVVLVDVIHENELLLGLTNLPEGITPEQVLEQIADEEKMTGGMRNEFIVSFQSALQVAGTTFPNRPLHILSAGLTSKDENPASRELRVLLHKQLAESIPGAIHKIAENSHHHIQDEEPQLIIDAIKEVIE